MTQSTVASIIGLFSVCRTLYSDDTASDTSPAYVCLGHPGSYQPNDIVAVAKDVREPKVERPTIGTNRSREKAVEIDVVISVFVPGMVTDDVNPSGTQVDALTRACSLSDQLEVYFKTVGTETLSGGCRDAWVSAIVGPSMGESVDPASGTPVGRVAELTLTVTAHVRY